MTAQGFPNFANQPGLYFYSMMISGGEVTTTSSSAGLDGRGQAFADISDDGANVQTIVFKRKFADIPYVNIQPLTANGAANAVVTETGIVLTGVERDDNTAPLADQDFIITLWGFNTPQFFL